MIFAGYELGLLAVILGCVGLTGLSLLPVPAFFEEIDNLRHRIHLQEVQTDKHDNLLLKWVDRFRDLEEFRQEAKAKFRELILEVEKSNDQSGGNLF